MKLLIFLSQLCCKHSNVYTKKEYRVYEILFRNDKVKRYHVVEATYCTKCNKHIKDEIIETELTRTRLHTHYKIRYAEIDNITKTIK